MRPSSKTSMRHLALAAAALLLSACSILRPIDDGSSSTFERGQRPAKPGETTAATPGKPGEKPAEAPKPPDKGDPQARFDQALTQMKGNQAAEAEASLTSLIQDFPEFAGPWTNLGILYAKSNRAPQAINAFNKAIERNDDDATAYNWLGILYRQQRDYGRAEKAYKAAIDAKPDLGLAHLNLGILYDEYLQRPMDALAQYKEYQRLGGKDDLRVSEWIAEIEHPELARSTGAQR